MNNPITITTLVPGGQGIGTRPDGKKGFFWNALPKEIITEYQITKEKSSYFEAIATHIENPATYRIPEKDPCFLSTSPWQIMSYEKELIKKRELLLESFLQEKLFSDTELGNLISPVKTDGKDFFYRNKMEYSLFWDHADEKIHLSFHQRGSHKKIPIKKSSLERPEIFQRATEIVADLNAAHASARDYQSIMLRTDQSGQVSGGLLPKFQSHPTFPFLKDSILGQEFSYSVGGFFQINLPVYEMALEKIRQATKASLEILDLYAGVGTIGLSVAKDQKLTLVESNKAAYAELEKNCQASIKNFTTPPKPLLSPSEEALDFIQPHQTVIIDPPRAGCDQKLLEKLLDKTPEKIIYLSCNPTTQARDLKILEKSYHPDSITPFNFFPRTPHLENLVILSKN